MAFKERQDVELCAQRATLQQQRAHIDILESALNNAQLHIGRLEEQVRPTPISSIKSYSEPY